MSHGSVVYSGPTERCLPHFAALGYEPEQQTNPLDFLIDVSSIDTRDADAEEESRKRLGTLRVSGPLARTFGESFRRT
jgi:hypothetical protein